MSAASIAPYSANSGDLASRRALWAGRALSGLAILFLVMDGAMKLVPLQPVIDSMAQLGWPSDPMTARMLAVLILVPTLLYAIPRTAILGAILLTGYLGGAVATHVRIGNPIFSHALFGAYIGIILWGGLWFRDARVRALIPLAG